ARPYAGSPGGDDGGRGDAHAEVASGEGALPPLMPLIIDAVRARATVGEISDTLQARWGQYRPS
ncbi:MAG TPA: hypothetical protein VFV33_16215, partial [Gemmatimonadaceae bacterium]|nr:hypothetical protein [Gemmatimonadaceae bacterium]